MYCKIIKRDDYKHVSGGKHVCFCGFGAACDTSLNDVFEKKPVGKPCC